MSITDRSPLSDLARFVGRSPLAEGPDTAGRPAIATLAARLAPPPRRSMVDLLGAVLALSARTRRAVMPPIAIELDVFAPSGRRAVELSLGRKR